MADKLVLLSIDDNETAADWGILSDNKLIGKVFHHSKVENIDSSVKNCDTYVIFSSNQVSLLTTNLPSMSRQKLQSALPYALEEVLATDVSDCEFCILSSHADEQHIAVISKAFLQNKIRALTDAGLSIKYFIPDVLCLPLEANTWSLLVSKNVVLLRTGEFSGYSIFPQQAAYFIEQILQTGAPPTLINLYQTSDAAIDLSSLAIQSKVHNIDDIFTLLSAGLSQASKFNCLSGQLDWRIKTKKTKFLQKTSAFSVMLCLMAYSLSLSIETSHLQSVANQYQQSIQEIYTDFFPKATDVIAPKIRITRELNRLRELSSGGQLRILLQAISSTLLAQSSIQTKQLDFSDNALRLKLQADTFQNIEQVVTALNKKGLRAKSQNAQSKQGKVIAELLISGGS